MNNPKLDADRQKIVDACHHDPFSVLGKHTVNKRTQVRVYIPYAEKVAIVEGNLSMRRIQGTDIFEWQGTTKIPERYRLIWRDKDHREHITHDPYCFSPQLSDFDMHLFSEGKHWHTYRFLGAHVHEVNGVGGVLFAVWAPNAGRVSVVGDFNRWDGRAHPMRTHGSNGIWELFIPNIAPGTLYKFEIRNRQTGDIFQKSDPYGQQFEVRPNTAAIVTDKKPYAWTDKPWMEKRKTWDWQHAPMSIYEVHLGSWQRGPEGEFLNYRELAKRLVDYVTDMGFSHIELLPITEHPFDGSWGYQTTGYYAPTSRYGTPDDFRYFIDYCHQHNIGVFLDWVPAHFPKDAHGLARFDGTPLYEHEDPRQGEHLDWETLIYNYSRYEVKNFLLSSALYWLEEMHMDGLRVDAVASMLYLDYSREDWVPNEHGGRENLDAMAFLRELNTVAHGEHPGVLIMAEESTSWPKVTHPTDVDGLGFSLKWNMGWMNDSLTYMSKEPIHRKHHQDMLTFSMLYAFTENFLLPFSHDEVVHGKGSMLNKMPGDEWQRFANLRLLYTYMFTHPGKKLLFMGTEFGQGIEWNSANTLDWYVLDYAFHKGLQLLVKDLNRFYHQTEVLYQHEFEWHGFEWIDCHDAEQSVLIYLRKSEQDELVIALNLTPIPRHNYQIGVSKPGIYKEVLNSDAECYGGSNVGNGAAILKTEDKPWMERPYSIAITLPPLAGIILKLVAENAEPEKIEQQKLTKKVASKKVAKTKEVASQKSADDNLAIA
ncbi:MAG: 1,4-alpha-glucan branching enzyme [Gammaproteobacteria bacterium]|nr:MAG: 1,4-alpha-glucan branching enzyme [Gammaproteobacteria bacterium]RKZ76967.1 MAG: 1,4-alpha-glucan branching enzyme [Gammaproteobacteria bacterium]